jgi:quercetin dioxygenase-like cupin family protein
MCQSWPRRVYVLEGRAQFLAGGRRQAVAPGSLIFVERALEHRFEDVIEDLTVLVFFAPAEDSLKGETKA